MKSFFSFIVALAVLTPAVFAGEAGKPCCPAEKAQATECSKAKGTECTKSQAGCCAKQAAQQAALRQMLLTHKGGQLAFR